MNATLLTFVRICKSNSWMQECIMELSLKNSLFSPEMGCVYFSYGSTILGKNILHHFSASFFITLQTSSQLLCGIYIIPCDSTLSLCGLKSIDWTFKRKLLPVTRTSALQGMKEGEGAHRAAAWPHVRPSHSSRFLAFSHT